MRERSRGGVLKMVRIINLFAVAALFSLSLPGLASASELCARGRPGGDVLAPPDLHSRSGVLAVTLEYHTTLDSPGRTLFCFQTPACAESRTLHVNPGDTINIELTIKLPPVLYGAGEVVSHDRNRC